MSDATAPAGWYPDGSGQLRWWDGTQWTANFASMPQPVRGVASTGAHEQHPSHPTREEVKAEREQHHADHAAAKAQAKAEKQQRQAEKAAAHEQARADNTAARDEKAHAKEVAEHNKHLPKLHQEWEGRRARGAALLEFARTLAAASSVDFTANADLIELRAGQRSYVAGSQGISFPIGEIGGHAVRYHVGETRGHVIQAPPSDQVIDSGQLHVESTRVTFIGAHQTRVNDLKKIVNVTINGGELIVSVSNRQKPMHVHLDGDSSARVAIALDLASGNQGVVSDLESQLRAVEAQEPRAIGAVPVESASAPA